MTQRSPIEDVENPSSAGSIVARSEDTPELRAQILNWVRSRLPQQHVELVSLTMPSSNGMSAETFLIDLRIDGSTEKFVMRREPKVNTIFVGLDNAHQHRVLRALNDAGAAPVPEVIAHEDDPSILGGRFFLMRFISGRTPPDNPPFSVSGWVRDLSPKEREHLWWSGLKAMAGVANFDWKKDLADLQRGQTTVEEFDRELDYYANLHAAHCNGVHGEFVEEALRWLKDRQPVASKPVLMWGDARLGNMIFKGVDCAAIIDWEMCAIGSVECDLAWWLYLDDFWHDGIGVARAEGWPSHAETIAEYGRMVGQTLDNINYYKAFAAFRSAVISTRFKALGILPQSPIEEFAPASLFRSYVKAA